MDGCVVTQVLHRCIIGVLFSLYASVRTSNNVESHLNLVREDIDIQRFSFFPRIIPVMTGRTQ